MHTASWNADFESKSESSTSKEGAISVIECFRSGKRTPGPGFGEIGLESLRCGEDKLTVTRMRSVIQSGGTVFWSHAKQQRPGSDVHSADAPMR